ncbi:hypothetical protein TNCV_3518751 [Trichonephila clavipes]|uniref:Uncharacterized protein n=1 Tax=Trichonephila clavipes TaxID=2585209 RepID=A0A8X6SU90_TRICX|nr:hypothetical protein TNCV_3518751 [Trichonephila clavipes]
MLKYLRFDIFELQETKLPIRLITTTSERRLVQGHEAPLRMIEDVPSELDNGDNMLSKYKMIKFIDFCEVWFLPESVARVAAIVGDPRCPQPRH